MRSESCAGHLPSLAFLVDFVNVLFREPILLRDLEEKGRGFTACCKKLNLQQSFYMMTFNFLIIKYIPRLQKNTKKKMIITHNPVSRR